MNVSIRIIAPVLFAFVCAAVLVAFLWWQLTQSTQMLQQVPSVDTTTDMRSATSETLSPVDPRDRALFALRQGDILALRGHWNEAEEQYALAVEADGGLPALRKLAQAQLQRRNMTGVRSTIQLMKKKGARSEDLLLLESIVSLRQGELVDAKKLLENAEDSPQKFYGLALLSMIEGDHSAAQDALTKVVSGWEPVLRSNARTLIAAYQEFQLFPESQNIHLITLLSRALAQVQECELALPLLIQVTQSKDNYRDAWIVQGYCELVTERANQALASLEQAYNLDPQKPETQYFLGRAYSDTADYANAVTYFQYALINGFQPESEVRRHLAETTQISGNLAQAAEQYFLLTQLPDATLESFYGSVSTSIAQKKYEDAFSVATSALKTFPEDASAYELLGWAAQELGRTEDARTALRKALEINPYLESAKKRLEVLK
jgi:tetratricopeptide (TPR) repeat protein